MADLDFSAERIKKLRARMQDLGLDAVLTLDTAELRWLTTWTEVFDEEQAHLALVTADKTYLHTDARYSEAFQERDKQGRWQINKESVGHFAYVKTLLVRSIKQGFRLGYASTIRLDLYKALKKALLATNVKLVETKGLFEGLRAVKDASEILLLRKAQDLTDAAFADALTWIKPGMTELEIANRLEFALREKGAQALSFPSIVASGPHSALPHARPSLRRLKKGDFLLLDFGARYLDYCADMTRTVVLGKATSRQRKMYDAVLAAQTKTKDGIRAGITGSQAYELACESLKQEGLDQAFTHSLGHGLGIAVHELPTLFPRNTDPLVADMVVTIEPGVYFPGYGGVRIEDFGQVTETGFTCFTKSPLSLIELKR